jgi:hypothetical protein
MRAIVRGAGTIQIKDGARIPSNSMSSATSPWRRRPFDTLVLISQLPMISCVEE